jgi:hypothetical protein
VKGSIPVIVTLWRFVCLEALFEKSVFMTSLEIRERGEPQAIIGELDFVVLNPHPAGIAEFKIIIGEARSKNDYEEADIAKVRRIVDRFGREFVKSHVVLCFSTLKDTFSDSEKTLLRGLVDEGYEVVPLTRLELDPYDLFNRFAGLPNQYFQTLQQLGANTRKLNL